ncbi:phage antirepressor KilAC domain-containing protein [Symbiopectobacterium sp. RP]
MQLSTTVNPTMSSREIADLVRKEHKNVLRVIRDLIGGGILAAQIEPLKFEYRGQQFDYYELNKRDSLVLVARLSPEFTAAVVDRWQELESLTQLPTDYLSALKALTAEVEQRQQLENQLAIAAPKVEFADRVGEAAGVLIGNYAKTVGLGPNKLFAWLRDKRVLIASGARRNVPMQEYMDRGYFTVRETPVDTNHGIQISFTTKITGKGQQWLTRKMLDAGLLKAVGNAA